MARMKDKKKAKRAMLRMPGMKDVEGKLALVDRGSYQVVVDSVEQKDGNEYPYFSWTFKITGDEFTGQKLFFNTSTAPQSLWNLRSLLEAMGADVPDEDCDVDPEDLIGAALTVEVEHEKHDGKIRAHVTDYSPAEGIADPADDEDEPKSKKRARDEDEDEPKKGKKSRRDEDEDDEEDEPKSKKGKAKKIEVTEEDIRGMDQDELEDLIKTAKLDVDLSDFRNLRKMQAGVVAAAEEAGLIE